MDQADGFDIRDFLSEDEIKAQIQAQSQYFGGPAIMIDGFQIVPNQANQPNPANQPNQANQPNPANQPMLVEDNIEDSNSQDEQEEPNEPVPQIHESDIESEISGSEVEEENDIGNDIGQELKNAASEYAARHGLGQNNQESGQGSSGQANRAYLSEQLIPVEEKNISFNDLMSSVAFINNYAIAASENKSRLENNSMLEIKNPVVASNAIPRNSSERKSRLESKNPEIMFDIDGASMQDFLNTNRSPPPLERANQNRRNHISPVLANIIRSSGGDINSLYAMLNPLSNEEASVRQIYDRISRLSANGEMQSVVQMLEGRELSAREVYEKELQKARLFPASIDQKHVTYVLNIEGERTVPKKFNDDLELINQPNISLPIAHGAKQFDIQIWFDRTKGLSYTRKINLVKTQNGAIVDENTYMAIIIGYHIKLAEYYLQNDCIIFGSFAQYMCYCAKEKMSWQDIRSALLFATKYGWFPMDLDIYYYKMLIKPPQWESIQIKRKRSLWAEIYDYRKMLCEIEDPIYGRISVKVDLFEGSLNRLPACLVTFDIDAIYCTKSGLHSAFATLPPDTPEGSLEDGYHIQAFMKEIPNGLVIAQPIMKGPDYANIRKLQINMAKKLYRSGYKIRGLDKLVPISKQTTCSICNATDSECFGCNACSNSESSNVMCVDCFFQHCQESASKYSFWKCPFCRNERPILPSNSLFQQVYDFIDLSVFGINIQ